MTGSSVRGGGRPFDILLVESERADVDSFLDSFEAIELATDVHVVSDGDDALDFVHERGEYAGAPRPDLILLDLYVTGVSGEDVLAELSEHAELRSIPVLVVTASDAPEDVTRSYELNANAYVQKPTTADEFAEFAEAIEGFWLRAVRMPPKV